MRQLAIALAAGVLMGAGSACLLELDRELACGDGFMDELVGEECDPGDPSTFEDACRATTRPEGKAACDPDTCMIIDDIAQCGVCGDGFVDEELEEECDSGDVNGVQCPSGRGQPTCINSECKLDFSSCDPCGDGVLDEGEECDPGDIGDVVVPQLCADTETGLGIPNLFGKPYASGQVADCDGNTCRWERTGCGFCGDGVRDVGEPIDANETAPDEWCDGGFFDKARLEERFGPVCTGQGERPNAGCGDDCRSFIDRTMLDGCCLEKGAPCPDDEQKPRCCYEYDNPDAEDACQLFNNGGQISEVCR